ncbi:gamma-glutamyltransferase [Treponema medium]|uniref:gamma-glutamyltransferase n=1 Tax=Treponema medium TaxID=58231 RepID=UPI00059397F9|nr:gamma-glutamyltransferase [Treponema medium]
MKSLDVLLKKFGTMTMQAVAQDAIKLENGDIKKAGHNSAQYIHLLAEAMKIAFADRSIGLGDPDFIKIDTHKILSKDYAKLQYEHINKTAQEYKPGIDTAFDEHKGNTSHFSIMEA